MLYNAFCNACISAYDVGDANAVNVKICLHYMLYFPNASVTSEAGMILWDHGAFVLKKSLYRLKNGANCLLWLMIYCFVVRVCFRHVNCSSLKGTLKRLCNGYQFFLLLLIMPILRPYLLLNVGNYLWMTKWLEPRNNRTCLPNIISNFTSIKNELWNKKKSG